MVGVMNGSQDTRDSKGFHAHLEEGKLRTPAHQKSMNILRGKEIDGKEGEFLCTHITESSRGNKVNHQIINLVLLKRSRKPQCEEIKQISVSN